MSRTRHSHRRRHALRGAKRIESHRYRARIREALAMGRAEDLPSIVRHCERWDIWNWD